MKIKVICTSIESSPYNVVRFSDNKNIKLIFYPYDLEELKLYKIGDRFEIEFKKEVQDEIYKMYLSK